MSFYHDKQIKGYLLFTICYAALMLGVAAWERMQSLLQNGEKITPKQWKAEIQSLQSECNSIGKKQTKAATELACAGVISYNRKNLEWELLNESRQQSKTKRREGGRNLMEM